MRSGSTSNFVLIPCWMNRIGKVTVTGLGGLLALEGYYGFALLPCVSLQMEKP